MFRKIFLAVLPAIMVLSSCGAAPKADKDVFIEDTLAHEEIFGEPVQLQKENTARKPEGIDEYIATGRPSLGIQTATYQDKFSIRFVAAINIPANDLNSTVPVWTRTIYNANGSVKKSSQNLEANKVYTSLKNGDNTITIQQFNSENGTSYDYFAVYTILKIDLASSGDCFVNAYVTVGSQQSKVLATKVDQSQRLTFEPTQHYFLRGTIGGVEADLDQDAENAGEDSRDHASFTTTFKANDEFILVANASDYFIVYSSLYSHILEGSNPSGQKGYLFSDDNGKVKVNYEGEYVLYLNNQDQFYYNANNIVRPVYIKLADSASAWSTSNQLVIYAFKGENSNRWFNTTNVGGKIVTSDPIDPTEYEYIKIVEINSGAALTWVNEVGDHETDNLSFPAIPTFDGGNVQDCAYAWHREWNGSQNFWGSSWGTR